MLTVTTIAAGIEVQDLETSVGVADRLAAATPVARLVASTLAPGTTAADASLTVPVNVARVDWARASATVQQQADDDEEKAQRQTRSEYCMGTLL